MNRRLILPLLMIGIAVLVLVLFIALPVGVGDGGDKSSSIVPFIPIWFAAMIPIFVANQEEKKKKGKIKHRLVDDNRYRMMKDFVHQLNDDEFQYLHQRLEEASDRLMASQ